MNKYTFSIQELIKRFYELTKTWKEIKSEIPNDDYALGKKQGIIACAYSLEGILKQMGFDNGD